MPSQTKFSNGPNDRPKNETIAQSGPGLPDDSGGLPEGIDDLDPEAVKQALSNPPPHKLQQEPAEGSREVVDRELKRQAEKDRR
jgi:hypothetical protein